MRDATSTARASTVEPASRMPVAAAYIRLPSKGGHDLHGRVEGPLIVNDMAMALDAAVGHGLACVMEDRAAPCLADGRLVRVAR